VRPSKETSVLVLAMGAGPAPELLLLALRRGWAIRKPASVSAAFLEVIRDRPRVVVIQISKPAGEEIALIRLIRESPLSPLLVAITVTQTDEIERAVRTAGVDCYIVGTADGILVEKTVVELLGQKGHTVRDEYLQQSAPRGQDAQTLSSSFFLPTDMGGGLSFPAAHFLGNRGR